eukprot:s1774_g8.t1
MFDVLTGWLTSMAEAVTSQGSPELEPTVKQMEEMILFLKPALSYGDPTSSAMWAHTPTQADQVIETLRRMAGALSPKNDQSIVDCFLEKKGLQILVESLLSFRTPNCIRAQGWQSLCLILQSIKDSEDFCDTHLHT